MQIGTVAMRTKTGDFLPAKPLYLDIENTYRDKILERFFKEIIIEKTKKQKNKRWK